MLNWFLYFLSLYVYRFQVSGGETSLLSGPNLLWVAGDKLLSTTKIWEDHGEIQENHALPLQTPQKSRRGPKIIGLWIDKKLQNLFMYQFVANNTMFLLQPRFGVSDRSCFLSSFLSPLPLFLSMHWSYLGIPKYRRGLKMSPPGLMMYLVYSLTEADAIPVVTVNETWDDLRLLLPPIISQTCLKGEFTGKPWKTMF